MRAPHDDSYVQAARAAARAYSPRPLTAGEQWTVDALLGLRAGGYGLKAWRRFLGASLQRSAEARVARPQMASQAARWGITGAVAWEVACQAGRERAGIELGRAAGLAWWIAVWRMLDWHLGMAEGGDGIARVRLSPADAVTMARFWLVPAVAGTGESDVGLPAAIAAGGLTDWLDGALARRYGRTRLGRDLDTFADLAFVSVAVATARRAGRLPALGGWAIGARHAIGFGLSLVAVFGRARRPAIRARRGGAAMRLGGLVLATAGATRAGTTLLVAGCAVPPRSTARHISLA